MSLLWSDFERRLTSPRVQALLLTSLALGFVLFRWLQRLEPWNSDELDLFQISADALQGKHWLLGPPTGADVRIPHPAFRIGLFPFTLPAMALLGANATAFYLVPLLFALLGFGALYWVLFTQFGPLTALLFAVIHLAWPFELQHSSLLLTDLPSAACSVLCFSLLEAASRRTGPRQVGYALLAGLAGVESQLLRNNALALLAPAFLIFVLHRPTRRPALWAGALVGLGALGQQLLFVQRGLGWGADWRATRADFADYERSQPIFAWSTFLVRQFVFQLKSFGRGPLGALAVLLVVASLIGHALLLLRDRRVLLRALAAFGLFTWLLFSFSIYELVPGGVRAMVSPNFRFLQPFAYSSLVVWAWAWCELRIELDRAPAAQGTPRASATLLRPLALGALPLLLACFAYTASLTRVSTYRSGPTQQLVRSLEARVAPGAASVAGTAESLRVPQLFCCSGVEWRALPPSELLALTEARGAGLVLRDVPRELGLMRYAEPAERQSYLAELSQLETSLWHDYSIAHVDGRYALFATTPAGAALPAALVEHSPPSGTAPLDAAPCRSADVPEARTLFPPQSGRSQSVCDYSWSSDGIALLEPAAAQAGGLVLRVEVDYEPPLAVAVAVLQDGAEGLQRRWTTLYSGASYVPVSLRADARTLYVVYRVTARSAPPEQGVRIHPAQWRRQPDARAEAAPDGQD